MITTLHIQNIGIIDDLNVELGNGFNVFTGETGAGKTLIIDAINIISGGRFSKEMIRKGADFSFVELNLYLPGNELAIDDNIIVSREINLNGKNQCKINGRMVTVAELKEFMNSIIDIHGQNDNQKILNPKYHIKYLDNYGGEKIKANLDAYKELYKKYVEIKTVLKENLGDDKERQRELDLLQYQFDEIDKADLKINEEETLKEKSTLFQNSEKINNNLSEANEECDNAIDLVNNAIKALDKISGIDEKYNQKLSELKSIYYEIDEFSRDIASLNDDVYFDEDERNEIEERLDLITSLKRKYGNSIEEILEYRDKIEADINRINNLDETNDKLRKELQNIENKMEEYGKKLHEARVKISTELCEKINKELQELEMPNAKFYIEISDNKMFNKRGKDNIEFYISTNVGEDKKELAKTASGGEMSRIMLAIKTVFANTDNTPIMIFDEIDTGISGKAANSVGTKLKLIGKNHQVICITHQPSIAAKGDQNYYISKETKDDRTHTLIKHLKELEVLNEIARIASGTISDISLAHAKELRSAV
jgi:DNA repair protein RecN (Recombination protein N)